MEIDCIKESLTENACDVEETPRSAESPPPAKKKKCLGTLFKDNEEERNVSPTIISKEQHMDNELHEYLSSPKLDFEDDPLKYWKENEHNYPYLSLMAKKYLCVCATSSSSERLFSTAGNIVTPVTSTCSMKPETVDMLTFLAKKLD